MGSGMARRLVVVAAMALAGCGKTYVVEMSVDGDQVQRSTSVYARAETQPFAQTEPSSGPVISGAVVDGIGENSHVLHYGTSVGRAWIYVERIRGDNCPAEVLQDRFASADQLADLLADFAGKRFSKHKEYPKLRRFLDEDLRKDLKNLSAFMFVAEASKRMDLKPKDDAPKAVEMNLSARLVEYLLDHQYLSKNDVPVLFVSINSLAHDGTGDLVRTILHNKAGLKDEAFINDLLAARPDGDPRSFNQVLIKNRKYLAFAKEHRQEAPATSPAESTPSDYAAHLVGKLLGNWPMAYGLWPWSDQVNMSLKIHGSAVVTNGEYRAEDQAIYWINEVSGEAFPVIQYAVWSQPDEAFQQQHFGGLAFKGAELAQYCLWRKGLKDEDGRRWDALLLTLTPQNIRPVLKAYADALEKSSPSGQTERARHVGLAVMTSFLSTPSDDSGEDK